MIDVYVMKRNVKKKVLTFVDSLCVTLRRDKKNKAVIINITLRNPF